MTHSPDLLASVAPVLRRLAPPDTRLLVAASGGPDSQTLVDLVGRMHAERPWPGIWVMGVDHGLRPAAAAELGQAEALAWTRGLPFIQTRVQVPAGGNLLAEARRARYRALYDFASTHGVTRIAVAHTATDQVETVLHHLARGSGLEGMVGIRERRGMLIRPLLSASRAAIIDYLNWRELGWAEDPSNADSRRMRARLRANVLPGLRSVNPQLERSVTRWATSAREDARHLDRLARRELRARAGGLGSLDVRRLASVPRAISTRVLRRWLALQGMAADRPTIERLLLGCTRSSWRLCVAGRQIVVEAGRLWGRSGQPHLYDEMLPIPGCVTLAAPATTLIATQHRSRDLLGSAPEAWLGGAKADRQGVAFDGDQLHLGLRVRAWRQGDRLRPFGLSGHVQVGDLFTNAKIPGPVRAVWPIVTHGDEILWVVGLRRSAAAPIIACTEKIVTLRNVT